MSIIIMSAVWRESNSKGGARLVLLSLADQANDDGWCWPSVGTIAARCNISERAVQQHLRALEEAGELVRESRSGHSSKYRVVLTFGGADSSGVQNLRGAEKRQGGEAGFGGGVKPASPRTINEPPRNRNSSSSASSSAKFEEFWDLYPKKVEKQEARRRWDIIVKRADPDDIIEGLRRYVDYWQSKGTEKQFIKGPAVWLNKGCWADELDDVFAAVSGDWFPGA